MIYGLVVSITGMIGDLAESLLKRDMEQKDSSRWLPGLGGVYFELKTDNDRPSWRQVLFVEITRRMGGYAAFVRNTKDVDEAIAEWTDDTMRF